MTDIMIRHLMETKSEAAELPDSDTLSHPLARQTRVADLTETQKGKILGGNLTTISQYMDVWSDWSFSYPKLRIR